MEKNKKQKRVIYALLAVGFWMLLWQLFCLRNNNSILLASPLSTGKAIFRLITSKAALTAVGVSFLKIAAGFLLAVVIGILLAMLSAAFSPVRELLQPLMRLVKAVPVASFIILALLFVSSRHLSVLISFLMVLPVIYTNILQGITSTKKELLQMAEVFSLPFHRKLRFIYVPSVLPYFVSAMSVGLGFCFKSGIAAEVIGLPKNSIGENLYQAKLYLLTDELFAWTAIIVLLSVLFEKLVMVFVRWGMQYLIRPKKGVTFHKKEGKGKGTENISFRNVSKAFDGKSVLNHLSISLFKGERVALMGPSGSGKSTVIKLLLGLMKPDFGTVDFQGKASVVFQEDRLCEEFDAVTNVSIVTGNPEEAKEVLTKIGLTEIEGKAVSDLSGGMKKRVAIVRALLADGEVLVLDEPFVGLDEERRISTAALITKMLRGRTLLLVTHHEEEADSLTNRVIKL